jgi:hypothetical protein
MGSPGKSFLIQVSAEGGPDYTGRMRSASILLEFL